ncbi:MAG: hypothetical protein ACD_12C00559G0002 [uncultured bacterium]|nr:MAG: hypothetical protein ACD_12C00559G0002 [uncultured bacterium]
MERKLHVSYKESKARKAAEKAVKAAKERIVESNPVGIKEVARYTLGLTMFTVFAFTLLNWFGPKSSSTTVSELTSLPTPTVTPTATPLPLTASIVCEEYNPDKGFSLEQIGIDLGSPPTLKVMLGQNYLTVTRNNQGQYIQNIPIGADVCKP